MFLRHMNRVLVGTMIDVAAGIYTVEQFGGLLQGRPRAKAGQDGARAWPGSGLGQLPAESLRRVLRHPVRHTLRSIRCRSCCEPSGLPWPASRRSGRARPLRLARPSRTFVGEDALRPGGPWDATTAQWLRASCRRRRQHRVARPSAATVDRSDGWGSQTRSSFVSKYSVARGWAPAVTGGPPRSQPLRFEVDGPAAVFLVAEAADQELLPPGVVPSVT